MTILDNVAYARAVSEYLPRPINDDQDNEHAPKQLERLSEIENPTQEQDAVAAMLVTLIEAFEERYAIAASTPLSVLHELMAANDIQQAELVPMIGSSGVTSEVLNGKRAISRAMAQRLGRRFNVTHTLFL